jgi:hypothetical protein
LAENRIKGRTLSYEEAKRMKIKRCLGLAMLLLMVLCLAGITEVKAEGVNDPPYFTRLGSYDALKDANKNGLYDTYKLWTDNGTMTVEGKVWSTTYAIRTGVNPASDLEIIRYYSGEILKKDGSIIFDGRDDSGRRDITGKFVNKDKKQVWFEAVAWNGGDDYRLTVIETK